MARVFAALPPNAVIVSYWDPTTVLVRPVRRGAAARREIVDDSNIAYDGLGDPLK